LLSAAFVNPAGSRRRREDREADDCVRDHSPESDPESAGGDGASGKFMGHSKIQTTFDTYGHLFPGSRDDVRERMDAYLGAAQTRDLGQGNVPADATETAPGL
jgi:hypothetical protein